MAESSDKRIVKIAILAALCIMWWPEIVSFLNPKPKKRVEDEDAEIDSDVDIEDDPHIEQRDDCEYVVYQPLSLVGLHTSDLLPEGVCYTGDSYWDDKPHTTGDPYADEQAEDYKKFKAGESELDNLDQLVLILNNTTDEDLDTTIGDNFADESVWGGDDDPEPDPEPDPDPEPSNFSSWFLPSLDELQAMYDNLHVEGVGGFSDNWYWSSSELSDWEAMTIHFGTGNTLPPALDPIIKGNGLYVRASRTFTAAAGQYSLRDVGPGGGLIFYIDGTTYYEAAESDIAGSGTAITKWSNIGNVEIGATAQGTAIGTGITNTAAIIAQTDHSTGAALIANNYPEITIGTMVIGSTFTIYDILWK